MDQQALRDAVKTIFAVNMNVQPGEKLLVVTDIPREGEPAPEDMSLTDIQQRAALARQVYEIAREEYPDHPVELLEYFITGQNGAEPPIDVAQKLLEYDVILLLNSYSLSHTDARLRACQHGCRIASMPGIEADMFLASGPLNVDYPAIQAECATWADQLTACRQVWITTPAGTDLSFSVEGRQGGSDHGLFLEKGEWGNLPAGEAFIAPLEGTANGRLLVPAGWYMDLKEDMALTFQDGYVTRVEGGGEVGRRFESLLHLENGVYKHRRNCAELGIGTNPNARRADNVLEAEKIRGTIHIAVGDSSHMSGTNASDMHEDFIIPGPTMYFDGKKVMGK
jgi:leucyl aminopeptidase (aminopeptidase T)